MPAAQMLPILLSGAALLLPLRRTKRVTAPLCSLTTLPSQDGNMSSTVRTGVICDPVLGCRPYEYEDVPILPLSVDITDAALAVFTPLPTPAAYVAMLGKAQQSESTISIIKYGAPWCRSCRALNVPGSRLDMLVAERWPTARLYSMELVRNGKAAGERMFAHYKARNITRLPQVEVYRGSELVEIMHASELIA